MAVPSLVAQSTLEAALVSPVRVTVKLSVLVPLSPSVVDWLEMPIDRVMKKSSASEVEPVIYFPHEATPEIVEAHLRADKNLTPETAQALSELFRVAYKQFSKPGEK